jgi:hypothetical protein
LELDLPERAGSEARLAQQSCISIEVRMQLSRHQPHSGKHLDYTMLLHSQSSNIDRVYTLTPNWAWFENEQVMVPPKLDIIHIIHSFFSPHASNA